MTFPKLSLTALLFTAGAFGVAVLVNTLLDQASAALARVESAAPVAALESKSSRLTEADTSAAPPATSVHSRLGSGYTAALLDPAPLPQAPRALALAEPAPAAQPRLPEPRPGARAAEPTPPPRSAPTIRAEDVDRPDKLVAQIARMKTTLNLTAEQETYWRPVEAELRKIAQQQPRRAQNGRAAKIAIDPASAQRLYWAAFPLILSLSADQKQIVRHTARAMGLEQVASAL